MLVLHGFRTKAKPRVVRGIGHHTEVNWLVRLMEMLLCHGACSFVYARK